MKGLSASLRTLGVAGVLALALAGCADGTGDEQPVAADPVSGGPLVAQLSAEEAALLESSLAQMAEFYGTDPAEREDVVRWVLTEEQDSTRNACMADLGYSVTESGGIDAAPEQHSVVQRDFFRCLSMYPPHPAYLNPWSDEQTTAQYEWTVEFLIPCIEAAGFSITDVPSRASFVQNWPTDPFYPMAQVPPESITSLETTCLQQAPSAVLWEDVSPSDWAPGMSDVVESAAP